MSIARATSYQSQKGTSRGHRNTMNETMSLVETGAFIPEMSAICQPKNHLFKDTISIDSKKSDRCPRRVRRSLIITMRSLITVLSALYSKFLVVFGLALPLTEVISKSVPLEAYNGFYIYLYSVSILFLLSTYVLSSIKQLRRVSAFGSVIDNLHDRFGILDVHEGHDDTGHGSFYLKMGAAVFGIGSMVFSSLEMSMLWFPDTPLECRFATRVAKPLLRVFFTILQLDFAFFNTKKKYLANFQSYARFGIGHLIATNLCEWINIIIEETKHELGHVEEEEHHNSHNKTVMYCDNQGELLRTVSPYLFPCTVEYSLICAITLLEIWSELQIIAKKKKPCKTKREVPTNEISSSSDCSHSNKGLVCGLATSTTTVTCLIVFFSLRSINNDVANIIVITCESLLYSASIIAMAMASYVMRHLPYSIHRIKSDGSLSLDLDITLLLQAQAGIYMFNVFSGLACTFSTEHCPLWPEMFSIAQTTIQTVFILDTWWKRCTKKKERENKPGRQLITYLRVVNLSLWIINITEKNRAQLRPIQMKFYGSLCWIIITHVSMPLAIFYRFHSAICFFEIWRNSYTSVTTKPSTSSFV